MMKQKIALLILFLSVYIFGNINENSYEKDRKEMVNVIQRDVESTRGYLGRATLGENVIVAMSKVQRHAFVPARNKRYAYQNRPLPIGYAQTISQPYIVAIMTDLLDLNASDRVLEIGTGSGYQAAILAEIVKEVYTVEVIRELGILATKKLETLGYTNIKTRIADGYYGWQTHAPYDAIIVTAVASNIPPALFRQLKPGGKMIIPVKSFSQVQHLILISKDENGSMSTRQILPVRFVPLTGGH